jgi:SsrA-binding protein
MSLIRNKKATLNYEILEKYTAGIALLGSEVKSLALSHATLEGAYVSIKNREAYLRGLSISPYQANNPSSTFDGERERKLLLNRKEIDEIERALHEKGLTLVPLSLYNSKGKIKVEIAVVRGKKKHDKREAIKKRDTERELKRSLKIK